MPEIKTIPVSLIDENPHRNLGTYPTVEKKVEALMRSFESIGIWEGIIAREREGRYQLAFGHHRLEAARKLGLKDIPVILRDLNDEQMLQFMGRENGEDYSTQFLIMLNTWEGGVNFQGHGPEKPKPIDIARILGWVAHSQGNSWGMNETAKACASAHALIQQGHLARENLEGLSVKAAKEIVQRAHSRMETIEKAARETNRPKKEVDAAKSSVAKGAKMTAEKVRKGQVAQKDIRSDVDIESYKAAATTKTKVSPLFSVFGKALADSIEKLLKEDKNAEKLNQIATSVEKVTMEEDRAILRRLDYVLSELGQRSENWRKRLVPSSEKIVSIGGMEKKNG